MQLASVLHNKEKSDNWNELQDAFILSTQNGVIVSKTSSWLLIAQCNKMSATEDGFSETHSFCFFFTWSSFRYI